MCLLILMLMLYHKFIKLSPQQLCYFYFLYRLLIEKLERTSYFGYTCSVFSVVDL